MNYAGIISKLQNEIRDLEKKISRLQDVIIDLNIENGLRQKEIERLESILDGDSDD